VNNTYRGCEDCAIELSRAADNMIEVVFSPEPGALRNRDSAYEIDA